MRVIQGGTDDLIKCIFWTALCHVVSALMSGPSSTQGSFHSQVCKNLRGWLQSTLWQSKKFTFAYRALKAVSRWYCFWDVWKRHPYLLFYGHLVVWHSVGFTHMTYPLPNLSWQGEAYSSPINDRLNQWDASLEQRAGQLTLQSSENTIWKCSVLLFQMYQQNGKKVFFTLSRMSPNNLINPGF